MWFYEYLYFLFRKLFIPSVFSAHETVVRHEKQLYLNGKWTTLCCIYVERTGEKLGDTSFPTDTAAAHN